MTRRWWWAAGALPVAFLATFYAWPVTALLERGLRPDGALDLAGVRDTLASPSTRAVVAFTLQQAAASTLLTLFIGLPLAHVLARYRFRGRRLIEAAVIVPFVLPTVVVAAAFVALLGQRGPVQGVTASVFGTPLDLRHSMWAIIAAHAFFNVAVVVRTVSVVWERLDRALPEAAAVLGAGRVRAWLHVELPLLAPAILAASAITFLFSATSFAAVLVLGGPRRATIEVEIWRTATQLLDLGTAATLAVVQLLAVVALVSVTLWLERRTTRVLPISSRAAGSIAVRGRARIWVGCVLGMAALLVGAPLLVMVERSLWTGQGYSLDAWLALRGALRDSVLFVAPGEAILSSLRIAATATFIAVPLGILAALALVHRGSRWREVGLLLPLGTSAVTVGFGMLLAFGSPPLAIRSSPWLVPVAHAVVALPFVVRVVLPLLRAIDPALRDAAAVAGASPAQVLRNVDLPIVGRAAAAAAGFAFAISLGEFGATTFLARAQGATVPLLIERLLGQPGVTNVSQAMALSTVLALMVLVSVLAVQRWRSEASVW